jgi:hypothetical protein
MIYIIIFVFCTNTPVDSLILQTNISEKESYTKQILLNGIVGISFGIGTGVFYRMGNNAYDEYEKSTSTKSALDNWNKTKVYDNLRNVCAVGALFFTIRAVYYQLKNIKASKSTNFTPVLDFQYCCRNKWSLGLKKRL